MSLRPLLAAVAVFGCFVARSGECRAQKYSPESPEVKALVDAGVKFLSANDTSTSLDGEKVLGAYAIMKAQLCYDGVIDPNNKVIQEALQHLKSKGTDDTMSWTYTMCVKLLFLSALDPVQHRPEIDAILSELISRQKAHGGWGYEKQQTGDTSMSQMAVLTLWELEHHGIVTPDGSWEKVANWFLRTQDPSGGFGYQGREGTGGALVNQVEVRESLTAGAAGSLYIILDHMNGGSVPKPPEPEVDPNLPPELQPKEDQESAPERGKVVINVDRGAMQKTMDSVDAWMKDSAKWPPERHIYYYLYALERYHAYKDRAEGNEDSVGGAWYDNGVDYLRTKGDPNTGWRGEHSPQVDTAFAILFLVRSSKVSLSLNPPLGDGTLTGARGLKGDLTRIGQDPRGRLRPKKMSGPAAEIIEALNDPDKRDAALVAVAELVQQSDDATLDKHAAILRRLVGSEDPAARAAALQTMKRQRNLDDVPTLIYCLNDPHPEVQEVAHEALRFISRRLTSAPLALPSDEDEHANVVQDWKDWFLTIRPNAVFDE